MEKLKNLAEVLKSVFELLKLAIIPIICGVILFYPTHIKTILRESGINKISGMGVEINVAQLEQNQTKTTEVANNLEQSQQKIDSFSAKLDVIQSTTKDPNVITKVEDLKKEFSGIKSEFKKADYTLKKTMIDQEQTIENVTGKSFNKSSGWIFLGKANKKEGEWIKNYKLNINTVSIPVLSKGNTTVTITDDVYLRDGDLSIEKFYSNLKVKKVIKEGTSVNCEKVGYTKAIGGGVFVWIYINE